MTTTGEATTPQPVRSRRPAISSTCHRKLRPHADTATSELGGVVMVNDIPPGSGAFHCWPGSHLRTHPLWTTRFGNVKTKEQEETTREEVAAIVADTVPTECVGKAGEWCTGTRGSCTAPESTAPAPPPTRTPPRHRWHLG